MYLSCLFFRLKSFEKFNILLTENSHLSHFTLFPEHHNLSQVKENIAWNGEILKDYLFIYQKY